MRNICKKTALAIVLLALMGCSEPKTNSTHTNVDNVDPKDTHGDSVVQDENKPYFVITADHDLMVHENEGTVTFGVAISIKPESEVTVQLAGTPSTQGTLDHNTLVFTPQDWEQPQMITVSAVDNDASDGNRIFAIAFDVISNDSKYHQLEVDPVEIVIVDDDFHSKFGKPNTLQFLTDDEALLTDEYGSMDYIMFQMSNRPAYDVVVKLETTDPDEAMPMFSTFRISPDDWDEIVEIPVYGLDDNKIDGDKSFKIKITSIESKDPSISKHAFNFHTDEDSDEIAGINFDLLKDEGAVIIANMMTEQDLSLIEPKGGLIPQGWVSENGEFVEFSVALKSKPRDGRPVDVVGVFTNSAEARMEPEQLIFDEKNWNQPQTVRVYGVEDYRTDGDVFFGFKLMGYSEDMSKYGIFSDDFILVNLDSSFRKGNPEGTVVVRKKYDVLYTSESGATKYVNLSLNRQPDDEVKVYFAVSDETEGKIANLSDPNILRDDNGLYLIFNSLTWNVEQKIVVQGVDDDEADGNQTYYLNFNTVSRDSMFNGLNIPPAEFYNYDNEVTNEDVDCTSISELFNISADIGQPNVLQGDVQPVWISLACKPSSDVTIRVTNNYPGNACISGESGKMSGCLTGGSDGTVNLVFNRDDYKKAQPVYIFRRKPMQDGNTVGITIKPPKKEVEGMDPLFSSFNSLKIIYKDSSTPEHEVVPGISQLVFNLNVCSFIGKVAADGKTQTYHFHLASEPQDDVKVKFTIPDEYKNIIKFKNDIDEFTFKPSNYDVDQSVEIVSNDESVDARVVVNYHLKSKDPNFNGESTDEDVCSINLSHFKKANNIHPTTPNKRRIRIMAANTTSGDSQLYEDAGMRMFYAMDPDIILIQEYKQSAKRVVDLLSEHFGVKYNYYVDKSHDWNLANGIITKGDLTIMTVKDKENNQIIAPQSRVSVCTTTPELRCTKDNPSACACLLYDESCAMCDDNNETCVKCDKTCVECYERVNVNDRGYDAVVINLPGDKELLAFSLHLTTKDSSPEYYAVAKMAMDIMNHGNYYLVVGGDFNTSSRRTAPKIMAMQNALNSLLDLDINFPHDMNHNTNTNQSRAKGYDWLLVDKEFQQYSVPVEIGGRTYPYGYILDSRVEDLEAIIPVERDDSNAYNMQHMPVIRDFEIEY